MMGLRGSLEFGFEIEAWAARQPDTPVLSEAIRRLVELGLKVKNQAKPSLQRDNQEQLALVRPDPIKPGLPVSGLPN